MASLKTPKDADHGGHISKNRIPMGGLREEEKRLIYLRLSLHIPGWHTGVLRSVFFFFNDVRTNIDS